jgi:hypothetical protein
VVETFTFDVKKRSIFKVLSHRRLVPALRNSSTDYTFTDPTVTGTYAVGETYRFAPLVVNTTENIDAAAAGIGFTLENAPKGFLIDPSDGYVQGTPTTESLGQHTLLLFAVDSQNRKAIIENISLTITHKDEDIATNGPHNQDCGEFGKPNDIVYGTRVLVLTLGFRDR